MKAISINLPYDLYNEQFTTLIYFFYQVPVYPSYHPPIHPPYFLMSFEDFSHLSIY